MQTLTLLRHANSGYVDGLTDFKRNLSEHGRRDALNIAKTLRTRGCIPTHLLVSSAVRTRETAQIIREILGLSADCVSHLSDLYLASPEILQRELNQVADTPHLMLIGHNPGLEEFSRMLDPRSPEHMSACSLNHFDLFITSDESSSNRDTHRSGCAQGEAESAQATPDTHNLETRSDTQQREKVSANFSTAATTSISLRGSLTARLSFYERPAR